LPPLEKFLRTPILASDWNPVYVRNSPKTGCLALSPWGLRTFESQCTANAMKSWLCFEAIPWRLLSLLEQHHSFLVPHWDYFFVIILHTEWFPDAYPYSWWSYNSFTSLSTVHSRSSRRKDDTLSAKDLHLRPPRPPTLFSSVFWLCTLCRPWRLF